MSGYIEPYETPQIVPVLLAKQLLRRAIWHHKSASLPALKEILDWLIAASPALEDSDIEEAFESVHGEPSGEVHARSGSCEENEEPVAPEVHRRDETEDYVDLRRNAPGTVDLARR